MALYDEKKLPGSSTRKLRMMKVQTCLMMRREKVA